MKANEKVEALFEQALKFQPEERAAFLAVACGADDALRERIEELLKAHSDAGGFLPTISVGISSMAPILEEPGTVIGRYKLLERIGEGGFGIVYVAEQREPVKRRVALKIIKLGMDSKEVVARFEAERQALALMDHPNIAKVLDAGATNTRRPYIVMELVRGIRITDYCDQHQLVILDRLRLFIQICNAVQHAHQKGVIHRDIKPSNILVTLHDGLPVPKVIDFGIAKATQQELTDKTVYTQLQQFIGTPAYISPEQAEMSGLDIDTRADIYSLGVLLYELLTGQTPFNARELLKAGLDELRRTIREIEPLRPSTKLNTLRGQELTSTAKRHGTDALKLTKLLRGDLDWIVMKCLEKDRTRRYETANGLAADLQRHLNNEPVVARPPSTLYRFQKMARRNKLAFAAASAVLTALVLGISVSAWQAIRATRAEDQQIRLRQEAQKAQANEAKLRQQAEAAEKSARTEARRAEEGGIQLKLNLAASDFSQAVRLIDQDHGSDALPYLVRSLKTNPKNLAVLTRTISLLSYNTWMVPVLELKHSNVVHSAQFSPDGTKILTASANGAAIWNARNGQPMAEPIEKGRVISWAQFNPDGTRIVTGSADGAARLWDAQRREPLTGPLKHRGGIRCVQFSPDGKKIVTASSDGTIRVWGADGGEALTEPLKQENSVASARFSPDGKRIVTASATSAHVLDAETGQVLGGPFHYSNWGIWSAQFSPDGTRILTASGDKTARVWDVREPLNQPAPRSFSERLLNLMRKATIEPLKHNGLVTSAQFSPDGRKIVTASADNTVRVWDARNGQALIQPLKHREWVSSAEFSPDGKRIVTVSRDNIVRVWEVFSVPAMATSLTNGGGLVSAHFSPDSQRIVTASGDGFALVSDARTGKTLTPPLRHDGSNWGLSARFSPDGERIVTASRDNTARVWDARNGQPLTEPLQHRSWVFSAQFSPDGKRIVTASGETAARVWEAETGRASTQGFKHKQKVNSARYSPNGLWIVTASSDNTARVWDARTGQAMSAPLEHRGPVVSAQFSPDGERVVTAAEDSSARVWHTRSGKPLTELLRHSDWVFSAQFSADGERIVTASRDNTARVWDAQSGQALTDALKHNHPVFLAQFSADSRRIVTASQDFTARVWDAQTGQALTEPFKHQNWVTWAEFSPDGKRIITASYDSTAKIWDLGPSPAQCPDWFLTLAEAVSGQVLNTQGILESTHLNRVEVLQQLRKGLERMPGGDDWVAWGRWFLGDSSQRTISPFSRRSVTTTQPLRP